MIRTEPGDPSRHFFMTRSVARVMGVNLTKAMHNGVLQPESYASMVSACRDCALVEACETWLASRTDISEVPPPGCRISVPLSDLRKKLG